MNSDLNTDINAYQKKADNTLINNIENLNASKIDYDKNAIKVTLDQNVTMFDRFDTHIRKSIIDKWEYHEFISGKIVNVVENKVFCECLVSRDNSEFQMRKFDISLFEHLGDLETNNFIKIKLSQKPGSQRIDIIDGKGLGIEKEFVIDEDSWNIFDQIELSKPKTF